ncbi:hypothetical protein CDAR_296331 [Caerostris darwini]|uniref:Uncharacterized protein n=1 Tax=Caerostris darwini TaxID=1538125 RepID=A0AAV4PEW9_9ARAC|nr:hypothetical protein CDAR_296331 [Caerostris darwini]
MDYMAAVRNEVVFSTIVCGELTVCEISWTLSGYPPLRWAHAIYTGTSRQPNVKKVMCISMSRLDRINMAPAAFESTTTGGTVCQSVRLHEWWCFAFH